MDIARTAKQIAEKARQLGYRVQVRVSDTTDSVYLTCTDSEQQSTLVRISDHGSPRDDRRLPCLDVCPSGMSAKQALKALGKSRPSAGFGASPAELLQERKRTDWRRREKCRKRHRRKIFRAKQK